VKQGRDGVLAELDLAGMDAELAVLSGRTSNVARMEELIERCGEGWLEAFLQDAPR
jgi:type IV secretion system protein VirB4